MKLAVWKHLVNTRLNPEKLMRIWKDEWTENQVEIFLEPETNNIFQKYSEGTAEGYQDNWYILQR
jgi:hypothetical protein